MNVIRVALLVLLVQATGPQQSGSPSLQGLVLKVETNELIAKATVELRRSEGGNPATTYTMTTIKDGRFVFYNVPPGQYQLAVTRAGYVKASYGERRPGGPGIPIAIPAEPGGNVRIVMTPTGVISGRILNPAGQPLANATVYAMKPSFAQGIQRLSEVQSTYTNDLGEYRLFWLTPGQYFVSATPTVGARRSVSSGGAGTDNLLLFQFSEEATTTRPRTTDDVGTPVYYPGTLEHQSARPIDVKPGEELRGIDFFAAPVRTRHIRGVVVSAETQQPLTGSPTLRLGTALGMSVRGSPTTTFDLSRILPGSYTLSAEINNLSGSVPVEVFDRDIDNVVIPVSAGFNVSGRIVIEGVSAANAGPDVKTLRVILRPEPDTGVILNPATTAADGTFVLQSLYSGNYRVLVNPVLQNAYVKSVQFENQEVLNTGVRINGIPSTPLGILISANPGTITGTVVNQKQEPIPNAIVVLVPETSLRVRTQLFKNVTSDASGRFRIQAITPGTYKLFAWQEVENGAWLNADFMRSHEERGTPIQIREGETQTISLPPL